MTADNPVKRTDVDKALLGSATIEVSVSSD